MQSREPVSLPGASSQPLPWTLLASTASLDSYKGSCVLASGPILQLTSTPGPVLPDLWAPSPDLHLFPPQAILSGGGLSVTTGIATGPVPEPPSFVMPPTVWLLNHWSRRS